MSLNVLGVYLGHDPAACLLVDGEVRFLIEEERLTRFKHGRPDAMGRQWPRFAGRSGYVPWAAITYCLRGAGLSLDDLDALVLPPEWSGEGVVAAFPMSEPRKILMATNPVGGVHHFRHAMSAFYASPFEEAAVLVVDDDGSVVDSQYEAESGYLFQGREGAYASVFKNRYFRNREVRHGLGWMYHQVTNILGFTNKVVEVSDAGKTMGLAPYGRPSPALGGPWIQADGFRLDFSGFERWVRDSGLLPAALEQRGCATLVDSDGTFSQAAADVAFKVQDELEVGLVALARALHERTGARALCLAGGVALNSVANEKIRARAGFDDVFIGPTANDSGQALGLAYYGHLALQTRNNRVAFPAPVSPMFPTLASGRTPASKDSIPIVPIPHAYGGRTWPSEGIRALLDVSGLVYEDLGSPEAAARLAARRLAEGKILGWLQGGSEFGPRALGHRSILADPRRPDMKDVLNQRVKFREGFRPFAPSVLEDRASDVFELEGPAPFMLRVVPVRPEWRKRVPAITHVDDTARVQTVSREACPYYHELITRFHVETGVPLVLNTSFNLRGMPIVESPWDALVCFLFTRMDGLVMDHFYVPAPAPADFVFELAQGWKLALVQPFTSAQSSSLRATSPGGNTTNFAVSPALAHLVADIDGKRTLGELIADVDDDLFEGLQLLLRKSILSLRVGKLRLPVGLGATSLSQAEIETLVRDAGMISAHLMDL